METGETSSEVTVSESPQESSIDSSNAPEAAGGAAQPEKVTQAELEELGEQDLDRVVKVKIAGKEQTLKVRDALKKVELAEGAQRRMQEAAQAKKQAEQIIRWAQANPREFLKQTGIDPYEFAEATLAEKYEMLSMSPEQRRLLEQENELKQYKERERTQQEQLKAQREAAYESKLKESLDRDFATAWKESGLPADPYFGQMMAAVMLDSEKQKQAGLRDSSLQPAEAAAIVREKVEKHFQAITSKADVATLRRLIAKDALNKLREADIQRATGSTPATSGSQQNRPGQPASAKKESSNSLNEREYEAFFRNLAKS